MLGESEYPLTKEYLLPSLSTKLMRCFPDRRLPHTRRASTTATVSNSPMAVCCPGAKKGEEPAEVKWKPNHALTLPSGFTRTPPMPPLPSCSKLASVYKYQPSKTSAERQRGSLVSRRRRKICSALVKVCDIAAFMCVSECKATPEHQAVLSRQ